MDYSDLMKLVNAGFTKSEILAITGNANSVPAAVPDPIPEPEAAAPDPEPVPEVKPEAPAPVEQSAIDKLTAEVTRLTALVQKSNLLQAEQPAMEPPKAEDILASIIYPSHKGE